MQLDTEWLKTQGEDATLLMRVAYFQASMDEPPTRFAVAASGGGDSMALLHLAHRVAQERNRELLVVTVDHGLRPESGAEAAKVSECCARLGISHSILKWNSSGVVGNISAAARDARYRLIGEWACGKQVDHVLLGHTQDDNAENFLMALTRAAGIDGLSAMETHFTRNGVEFARPLATTSRADLRDYLRRHEITWADDPTNDDPAYLRTRVRNALPVLEGLGITRENLLRVSLNLSHARSELSAKLREDAHVHVECVRGDLFVRLLVDHKLLHHETERQLIRHAIQWVNSAKYPPRQSSQDSAMMEMWRAQKATIGGCVFIKDKRTWRITREHNAVKDAVSRTDEIWDNRWQLDGPHAPDLQIRALGEGIRDCPDWRETGMPRVSLLASPAVWRGDTLISAPLAGYNDDWTARIVADFHSYLLAH